MRLEPQPPGVRHRTVYHRLSKLKRDRHRRIIEATEELPAEILDGARAHRPRPHRVLDAQAVHIHQEPTGRDPTGPLLTNDQDVRQPPCRRLAGAQRVQRRPSGRRLIQPQPDTPPRTDPAPQQNPIGGIVVRLLQLGDLTHQRGHSSRAQPKRLGNLLGRTALLTHQPHLRQQRIIGHRHSLPQPQANNCSGQHDGRAQHDPPIPPPADYRHHSAT